MGRVGLGRARCLDEIRWDEMGYEGKEREERKEGRKDGRTEASTKKLESGRQGAGKRGRVSLSFSGSEWGLVLCGEEMEWEYHDDDVDADDVDADDDDLPSFSLPFSSEDKAAVAVAAAAARLVVVVFSSRISSMG